MDANSVIQEVRMTFPRLLLDGKWEAELPGLVSGVSPRTVRGQLWSVFLSVGKYDWCDPIDAVRQVPRDCFVHFSEKIPKEVDRIRNTTNSADIVDCDEFRFWLWLYSSWLFSECGQREFFQNLYTLGFLFLRNFSLPAAFGAFVHFIRPIRDVFLPKEQQTPNLKDPMFIRLQSVLKHANFELTLQTYTLESFGRVICLFSQIDPYNSRELVWDFLIVYGAHFVIYLEAAYLVLKKAGRVPEEFPKEWIVEAARIHNRTPTDVRQNIEEFVYKTG
jgi:hypothetical protein